MYAQECFKILRQAIADATAAGLNNCPRIPLRVPGDSHWTFEVLRGRWFFRHQGDLMEVLERPELFERYVFGLTAAVVDVVLNIQRATRG